MASLLRICLSIAVVLLAAACRQPGDTAPPARLVERVRVAMGSELRLTAWTADQSAAIAAFDKVFDEFERLESVMSVWREGSEVHRLNAAAGRRAVPIGRDMQRVLGDARQVSEWTGGKFDVTFGALSDLWKFDHDRDDRVPDSRQISARLPLVDYTALEVDERSGTAFLKRAGMRVHLGGIGKGYAVDRAVDILHGRGLRDFMIQAGGDLFVSGRRGDRAWRVGIHDPRGPADRSFASLDLSDATFSTAGDYERYFMHDGRRYHHILDPDVGEPARGCRSVTIVTDRATIADALSTGVFVLGPSAGMALIERLPNVEGVIVTDHNEVLVSSGLEGRLMRLAAPIDAP